jgi:hypothetical protein
VKTSWFRWKNFTPTFFHLWSAYGCPKPGLALSYGNSLSCIPALRESTGWPEVKMTWPIRLLWEKKTFSSKNFCTFRTFSKCSKFRKCRIFKFFYIFKYNSLNKKLSCNFFWGPIFFEGLINISKFSNLYWNPLEKKHSQAMRNMFFYVFFILHHVSFSGS